VRGSPWPLQCLGMAAEGDREGGSEWVRGVGPVPAAVSVALHVRLREGRAEDTGREERRLLRGARPPGSHAPPSRTPLPAARARGGRQCAGEATAEGVWRRAAISALLVERRRGTSLVWQEGGKVGMVNWPGGVKTFLLGWSTHKGGVTGSTGNGCPFVFRGPRGRAPPSLLLGRGGEEKQRGTQTLTGTLWPPFSLKNAGPRPSATTLRNLETRLCDWLCDTAAMGQRGRQRPRGGNRGGGKDRVTRNELTWTSEVQNKGGPRGRRGISFGIKRQEAVHDSDRMSL